MFILKLLSKVLSADLASWRRTLVPQHVWQQQNKQQTNTCKNLYAEREYKIDEVIIIS